MNDKIIFVLNISVINLRYWTSAHGIVFVRSWLFCVSFRRPIFCAGELSHCGDYFSSLFTAEGNGWNRISRFVDSVRYTSLLLYSTVPICFVVPACIPIFNWLLSSWFVLSKGAFLCCVPRSSLLLFPICVCDLWFVYETRNMSSVWSFLVRSPWNASTNLCTLSHLY